MLDINTLRIPEQKCSYLALGLLFILYLRHLRRRSRRSSKVAHNFERVLVLGATSGIGRAVAHSYAQRGARVCIVGRRAGLVEDVASECRDLTGNLQSAGTNEVDTIVGIAADFTSVEDMVRVREALDARWGGLDTLVVSAGVSALRPVLEIAGVSAPRDEPTTAGIQNAVDVAGRAMAGNFVGPLVAALTFIPLLTNTSRAPALLLVSSVAALIPAPTRALYGSGKAAALLLYRSLALEHPRVAVACVLPYTVEGDFRASAIDGGPVRANVRGGFGVLRREAVAARCVRAVDRGEGLVCLPWWVEVVRVVFWAAPGVVGRLAGRKYQFNVEGDVKLD